MRPPRLPREQYKGAKSVAFTACVEDSVPIFRGCDDLIEEGIAHLRTVSRKHLCNVPVYVFMPDHLHVLMQGFEFQSDPLEAMESFKILLSKTLLARGLPKMQDGFYDHIVRRSEDWRNQARYIVMNPVRAGIVEHFTDYPYLGSLHGDVRDLFH